MLLLGATAFLLVATPTASRTLWSGGQGDAAPPAPRPTPYRADCRTVVDGSRATAYCHNPYPRADRVRLHVECDRWWDVDADTAAARVDPAGYVELSRRCWKEVRGAWVSHEPVLGRA
ncbi:hypothetical protein [Streptomyces sp. NPDC090029]|uniref:hypothetical protein n=1 Tax=Streptomyces sp. NPDC090029 TaxID=3365924 RepID=UPI003827833F